MSTGRERDYNDIQRLTREVDALTAQRDVLRLALARILAAGDWEWSEADDATIYSIYLPESRATEFNDLLQAMQ